MEALGRALAGTVNALVWTVRCLPPASVAVCLALSDVVSALVMLLVCLGTTIGWRVRSSPRVEIALNVVMLVAAWSSVWGLYERWASWDLLVHFALTAMLAVLAERSLSRWILRSGLGRTPRATVTVLLGTALSVVWEIMEHLGHSYVSTDIEVGTRDTIGDVVAGVAGAAVAALWHWRATMDRHRPPPREGRR